MARYGKEEVVAPGRASDLLGGLPIAALRLNAATIESLKDVGIERIAQLATKPRGGLQTRFGSDVLLRMDQALGAAAEALVSINPPEVPRTKLRFPEPLGDPQDLQRVIALLCKDLVLELERRGVGARRLDLVFMRVDNIAQAVRIGTSRPNRNPVHLAKLLGERLVLVDPGFGIEEATLTASWIEAVTEKSRLSARTSPSPAKMSMSAIWSTSCASSCARNASFVWCRTKATFPNVWPGVSRPWRTRMAALAE